MNQRLIKRKLYTESLTCPIALTELVRQFMVLSEKDRQVWIDSLDYEDTKNLIMSIVAMIMTSGFMLMIAGMNMDNLQVLYSLTRNRLFLLNPNF